MRGSSIGAVAAAALTAGLVAGCTSSGAPAPTTSAPPSAPTVSLAPTISVVPSTPASSSAPPALSAFEADPSVVAFRRWTAQVGRTINAGSYTSPALVALSGAYMRAHVKTVLGSDVGGYYPGPLPFQPTGVTILSSTRRDIRGCLVANGWDEDKATHKPLHPYQVVGARAQMNLVDGGWVTGALPFDTGISCKGVTVRTERW